MQSRTQASTAAAAVVVVRGDSPAEATDSQVQHAERERCGAKCGAATASQPTCDSPATAEEEWAQADARCVTPEWFCAV
jgi:hypothetical protein